MKDSAKMRKNITHAGKSVCPVKPGSKKERSVWGPDCTEGRAATGL